MAWEGVLPVGLSPGHAHYGFNETEEMLVMEASTHWDLAEETQRAQRETQEKDHAREGVPEAGRSQRRGRGLFIVAEWQRVNHPYEPCFPPL